MKVLERVTEILNNNETCVSMVENGFTYDKAKDKIDFKYKYSKAKKSSFYIMCKSKERCGQTTERYYLTALKYSLHNDNKIDITRRLDNAEYMAKQIIESFESRKNKMNLQIAKETEKKYMIIYTENGMEKERFINALSTMDALRIFTQELCVSKTYTMEFKSIVEM